MACSGKWPFPFDFEAVESLLPAKYPLPFVSVEIFGSDPFSLVVTPSILASNAEFDSASGCPCWGGSLVVLQPSWSLQPPRVQFYSVLETGS